MKSRLKNVAIKRVIVILLLVSMILPMAIAPIEAFANSDMINNSETQDSLVDSIIKESEDGKINETLNETSENDSSQTPSQSEEVNEVEIEEEVGSEENNVDTDSVSETFNAPNETFLSRFELYTADGRSEYYSGEDFHFFIGLDRSDTINENTINTQIVLSLSNKNIDKYNLKPSIFYNGDKEIVPIVVEDVKLGKFFITYTFENLNSGISFDIGTILKANNYSTPNNTPITIEAESIANTEDGRFTIGKSNLDLSIKTYPISASQQVVTEKIENSKYSGEQKRLPSESTKLSEIPVFPAGSESLVKPGYLSSDVNELSFITFSYGLSKSSLEYPGLGDVGNRRYKYIKIEDTLPHGAVFIPEANPGWIYNEVDSTLVYIRNSIFSLGHTSLGNEYSEEDRIRLNLKFPDHRLSELIERNTTLTLTQNGPGENESPIVTTTKGYLKLTGCLPPESVVTRKIGGTLYDNFNSKSGVHYYDVSVESQAEISSEYNIYDLIVRDYNLNPNLVYESIKFPSDVESKFIGTMDVVIEYEEEVGDITPIVIEDNIKVTNSLEIGIPSNIRKENIKAILLKSKGESLILPAKKLEFKVGVSFKSPSIKILNNNESRMYLNNYLEVSANYNHSSSAEIKYTGPNSSFRNAGSITLLPVNHEVTLNKIQGRSSATFQTGDEVTYFMDVDIDGIVDDADYDFTYLVDFIPDGLDYVENSSNIYMMSGVISENQLSNGAFEPILVSNFRNSGKKALVWDIGSMKTKGAMAKGTLFSLTYNVKINKYLNQGSHEIPALLAWNNLDDLMGYENWDTSLVEDVYDLNNNGLTTDKVLESKTKLKVQPNKQLIISKKVKGNLDDNYMFEPGVGLSEIGTHVEYEFELNNRTDVDLNDVQILDIIPHIGDKTTSVRIEDGLRVPRGTTTPITLKSKIIPPSGFIVEYTDKPVVDNIAEFMNSDKWTENYNNDELYKVTAFRLKLKAGETFNKNSIRKFYAKFNVPSNSKLNNEDIVVNSFALSKDSTTNFFESNLASLKILKYKISGSLFVDKDEDGLYKEGTDKPIRDYTVTLVNEDGTEALDAEGSPYVVQSNNEGYYEFNVHKNGYYKVKIKTPSNHSSQSSSPIIDEVLGLTSKLKLDKVNRELTVDVGYVDNTPIEEVPVEPEPLATLTISSIDGVGKPEVTLDSPEDLIKGARFKLVNSLGVLIKEVNLEEGQAAISDIPYGEYVLHEITPPTGYNPSSPSSIDIAVDTNLVRMIFKNSKEIKQVPLEPSTRDISVNKTWIGGSLSKANVNLLANNKVIDTIELSELNGWKHKFQGLPTVNNVNDNIPIEYTIEEEPVSSYKTEIAGDVDKGFNIVNTKIVEQTPIEPISKVDVNVSKLWIGKKSKEANINLLLNGEIIMSTRLSEDNGWKHTFKNLGVTDSSGKLLSYSINETPIENYSTLISGNITDGFVVINKEIQTPTVPTINVSVSKGWIGKALESVRVNLYADSKYKDTVVLSEDNNWKHTFEDLVEFEGSSKISYIVEEETVRGYTSEVLGNMNDGFTIINTEVDTSSPTPPPDKPSADPLPNPDDTDDTVDYINIDVKKIWSDDNRESITIVLLANGDPVDKVNLSPQNEMRHTFERLPSIDSEGNVIQYNINEVEIEGYTSKVIKDENGDFVIYNDKIISNIGEVEPEVDLEDKGDEEDEVPMTPLVEYMDVTVQMNWFGKSLEEVEVELLADGESIDKTIILNEANDWKHTFKDLLVAESVTANDLIIYSIKEINLEGYTSNVIGTASEGFVINVTEDGYVTPNEDENVNNNETYDDNISNNDVADVQTYDGGVLPFAMLAMLAGAAFIFISKKKKSM